MKHNFYKKWLSAIAIFLSVFFLWNAGVALAEESPSLHLQFKNEKVTGLMVTKEIYRKTGEATPLRSGSDADVAFYQANGLNRDEFIMMLLIGPSNTLSMRHAKSSISYTRSNRFGNYYTYRGNGIEGVDATKTLVIRPIDGNGNYEVYYYQFTTIHPLLGYTKPEKEIIQFEHKSNTDGYASLNLDEKFIRDFGILDPGNVSKNFSTGPNGEFLLFDGYDGDQVYFKSKNISDKGSYYGIVEYYNDIDDLNNLKIEGKKTGVYDLNNAVTRNFT